MGFNEKFIVSGSQTMDEASMQGRVRGGPQQTLQTCILRINTRREQVEIWQEKGICDFLAKIQRTIIGRIHPRIPVRYLALAYNPSV